jgi:hypothetical protein
MARLSSSSRAVGAALLGGALLCSSGPARAQQSEGPGSTGTPAAPAAPAVSFQPADGIPTPGDDSAPAKDKEAGASPKGESPPAKKGDGDEDEKPRLEITGFAMTDFIHDFQRMDPDWIGAFRPSKILINSPLPDGETAFSIRQSKLNFQGFWPTDVGEIKSRFEFDLFGVGPDAGQTTMRIRHVYGELGRFLAGQTNSVFMDGDAFPNVIDYWGPAGMVYFRVPQARWTPISRNGHTVAVSMELPGSAVDPGNVEVFFPELDVRARNLWPSFATHYRWDSAWGHCQLAGVLTNPGFESATQPEPHRTLTGGGVSLTAVGKVLKRGKVYAQGTAGTGISSYMNDGGTDLAPNSDLRAVTVPTLGYELYYQHAWNSRWMSSIGYSEHLQDNAGGQRNNAFHAGRYFSANLLYSPVPSLLMGGEFLWGERETKNGAIGNDNRIQLSAKYNFSN